MNFLSQSTSAISLLMNKSSSVFTASSILGSLFSTDNLLSRLLGAILQMLYFACKWVMYMVDVIYFYILQLAGVSADTSIFDSPNSDMTFNLLINNKDTVVVIIKNLVAIAIVLILVTAVMAIIKQQSQALKDKKAKKSPTGDVMRSVLKSFLLIILTPMIAILGIVASSVLLQSLFNATNLSDTKSLSARVFNASAAAANKYRIYADNGVRIPIKYKFSGDNRAEALNYTVQMIGNDKFPSLTYFDVNNEFSNNNFNDPVLEDTVVERNSNYSSATETWRANTYYTYYDTSENYSPGGNDGSQYKILTTHVNEYYAMSDVIMYAMDTMEKYYFVTIQELLESVKDDGLTFKNWIETYRIKFYKSGVEIAEDASGYNKALEALKNGDYDYIKFTSQYKGVDYEYCHVRDAVDEIEGAKFTIAYKVEDGNVYNSSLNGNYYQGSDGNYYEADTYYYKVSADSSKAKKVDLYYFYNEDKEKYQKLASFDGLTEGTKIYYKLGEDYFEITEEKKDRFYYKNKDREYVQINYDENIANPVLYTKVLKYHYAPLVNGISFNNNEEFHSTYLTGGLVTARGLFDKSSYPTAIRRLSNGDIMFYRDDLEMISDGSVSNVGILDQIEAEEDEDEEEEKEDKNIFQKIGSAVSSAWNSVKKFVTGLFNPLKLVPDLKLDVSKVSTTYTSKTSSVHELKDGELHLSYFFADSITSSMSEKMYGVNLNYLYDSTQINYIILVIGSVMFFKICVTAVFGLINRSLNLLIMIMIYPVACATIPYDEATGTAKNGPYNKWSQKYLELLFSAYGLLLSLNFVFIIIPVIDKLEFFTEENFLTNKALGRIGNAIYNPWMILGFGKAFEPNYSLIASYINKILRIIFQLSAFSVIAPVGKKSDGETFYSVIQAIVGTGLGALENSPLDAVKKTLKTMASTFNKVFFPWIYIKNMKEKATDTLKGAAGFIPGSAIAAEAMTKVQQMNINKGKEQKKDDLVDALKNKAPKEEVEAKLKDYKAAYGIK